MFGFRLQHKPVVVLKKAAMRCLDSPDAVILSDLIGNVVFLSLRSDPFLLEPLNVIEVLSEMETIRI